MRDFFQRALSNITKFGDTDIFPFPIENHVFFDKPSATIALLEEMNDNFSQRLVQFPPHNHSALVPVGYTGFRSATQLDPLWNAFFLGLVLSVGSEIESARIAKESNVIFSYRLTSVVERAELFDHTYNWRSFLEQSMTLAGSSDFVISCDISEFYPRVNHHRLENALDQLRLTGDQTSKIMDFLSNFSNTYSFGIPIGGPAARILSELLLNQLDRLLLAEGIKFCRFADDYHLFAADYKSAFRSLLFLSQKLLTTQGLQLQKSKTRISSGQEFIATSPIEPVGDDAPAELGASTLQEQSQNLMRLSLRFDPYSPTAYEDYETLRQELERVDIIGLLKSELTKSRIHISLAKKLVAALKFIDEPRRSDAILTLIKNTDLLYPIYANVLLTVKSVYSELSEDTQQEIISSVASLLRHGSYVIQSELNLGYAVRLLSMATGPEFEEILHQYYSKTKSPLIRSDIILAMARWRAAYWLSSLKNEFRTLSSWERRAFIIASYSLNDEGKHWRRHVSDEFSPFEVLVKEWASEKKARGKLEYSPLISSTTFAKQHTSTWKLLAPAMDFFVRRLRLQHQREFPPLQSKVAARRRALINQISFIYFASKSTSGWVSSRLEERTLHEAIHKARAEIASIDKVAIESVLLPTDPELDDCSQQVWRLQLFFASYQRSGMLEFFPLFQGCGIIDTSFGDVYTDGHLFEVKAGDRGFLSIDLKQLLTYAALNSVRADREIQFLGLFNPRVGISYKVGLEELCQEISGSSANEMLGEIVRVISSGDISR